MSVAPTENSLSNTVAYWVEESTPGEPPTDPDYNLFSDYLANAPGWSPDSGISGARAMGSGDIADHFRASSGENSLTLSWWMQRPPVDGSGNVQSPTAVPVTHDYQTSYPSHTVMVRRQVDSGGNDGGGFREWVVALGARPISATWPGDAAADQPIAEEVEYACQKVRSYVIHQPGTSGTFTPEVSSSSSEDTTQTVTIESEGASETDTYDLNGQSTVSGNSATSFGDIDRIYVDAECEGDLTITDSGGAPVILDGDLTGRQEDGAEGNQGVPLLGSGSLPSAIGTDPADFLFLGTSSTYDGGALAETAASDRVHSLELAVECDVTREGIQGTRRQAIDVGGRTATADATVAGPYEMHAQNQRYFRSTAGDLVYEFLDGTQIQLNNATPTEVGDFDKEPGDANALYDVTFEAHGEPAVQFNTP